MTRTITRWMEARGFRLDSDPLFPCDDELERGAVVISNADWVVVAWSDATEVQRLARELFALERPMLHVWVADSDVWGYALLHEGREVAEFDSNPMYHGKPAEPFLGDPLVGDISTGAPEELCRLLDVDVAPERIARLQRRRAVFKERLLEELCALLGVPSAATVYKDHENGDVPAHDGFSAAMLRYTRRDDRMDLVDVHAESAFARPTSSRSPVEDGRESPLPASLLAYMTLLRAVFMPLMLAMRLVLVVTRPFRRRNPSRTRFPPVRFRREGAGLVHDGHRCRITLPPGAEAVDRWHDPWAAFVFRVGGETMTVSALPPHRLRDAVPPRPAIEDEKLMVGDLKVRRLVVELPPHPRASTPGPQYLETFVVQGRRAIYAFQAEPRSGRSSEPLRQAVESFRAID